MMRRTQQELYLSGRRDGLRGRRLRQIGPERPGSLESRQLRRALYALFAPYLERGKDR